MDPYLVARGLHIFSAFILFGTGLGTAFHMYVACRSGLSSGAGVPAVARVARQTVQADWLFTTPAAVVQPVTGLWLVHLLGYDLAAPWLLASYGLYGVAGAAWLVVVVLQKDMARMAAIAARAGTALPDDFHRRFRLWTRLGWVGFLSLAGVGILMVAKPALW